MIEVSKPILTEDILHCGPSIVYFLTANSKIVD